MALSVGTAAPTFTLKSKNSNGFEDVNLADFIGKEVIVLLFVPAAFSSVCTDELCGVSQMASLQGAKTFGISVDSGFAQEAWVKKENISVQLLSDYTHKVTELYDVVLPDLAGMGPSAARAAFVIGKDGNIAYAEQTPTAGDLPNFNAIAEAVKGLVG